MHEQFNRKVDAEIAHRVRVEAAEARLGLDDLTGVILAEWFKQHDKDQRMEYYRRHRLNPKVTGAPTAEEAQVRGKLRRKARLSLPATALAALAVWLGTTAAGGAEHAHVALGLLAGPNIRLPRWLERYFDFCARPKVALPVLAVAALIYFWW